jgi:hypothetical protein
MPKRPALVPRRVTTTLIAMLQAGERGSREFSCPHCGAELSVAARLATTLAQAVGR